MSLSAAKMFEYGPGKKYRARADSAFWNGIRLDVRQPWGWEPVTAPDLVDSVLKVLARAAIGEPVSGFRWTNDEKYDENYHDGHQVPTLIRRLRGETT